MFEEFHKYTEKLIHAQYEVSEIIKHELTKGEVREEFVMDTIQRGFGNEINLRRGFLQVGDKQSNQMDILLIKQNAQVAKIGSQIVLSPENCLLVLEVKGNATGKDIKEYHEKIAKIKAMNADSHPMFGIFCYKIKLTEKTILNRFGYTYDSTTKYFYDEYNEQTNCLGQPILYSNIDFLISVEVDENGVGKQIYLRKNDQNGRYVKSVEFPVLKNLFRLTQSLLLTS